jgi:hypothetical protein
LSVDNDNDANQVLKLQLFLRDYEHLTVSTTGIFDASTKNAVEAFQDLYLSDIMGPWGATSASGNVYITTKNKINEIVCGNPIALSLSDLAIIGVYRQSQLPGQTVSNASSNQGGAVENATNTAPVSPVAPIVGVTPKSPTAPLTAAVSNAVSSWNRFWGFVWNHVSAIFKK